MTHREIQRAGLMMESGFHNGGASSLDRAARIDVCLPISDLAGKDTQTQPRRDHSNTQVRAPGQTYQIPCASRAGSLARDYFQSVCKPDSIPI